MHHLGWTIQNVPGTGFEGINDAMLQPGAHLGIIGVGGTQIFSDFNGEFLVSLATWTTAISTRNSAVQTGQSRHRFPMELALRVLAFM